MSHFKFALPTLALSSVIGAVLVFSNGPLPAYSKPEVKTERFVDLDKSTNANLPSIYSLKASVLFASEQNKTINLQVVIENEGTQQVTIRDLLRMLKITLVDSNKNIVRLPNDVMAADRKANLNNSVQSNLPFSLVSVTLNGKALSQSDVNSSALVVPASGKLQIDLSIDKVLRADHEVISLPPDKYSVALVILLLDDSVINKSRIIKSPDFQVSVKD